MTKDNFEILTKVAIKLASEGVDVTDILAKYAAVTMPPSTTPPPAIVEKSTQPKQPSFQEWLSGIGKGIGNVQVPANPGQFVERKIKDVIDPTSNVTDKDIDTFKKLKTPYEKQSYDYGGIIQDEMAKRKEMPEANKMMPLRETINNWLSRK